MSQLLSLAAVAMEAMLGRTLMHGSHMFTLGVGPLINASIFMAVVFSFKTNLGPLGQHLKTLQDQGADVSTVHMCISHSSIATHQACTDCAAVDLPHMSSMQHVQCCYGSNVTKTALSAHK